MSAVLSHGLGWLDQAHAILGMDQVSPAKLALSVLIIASASVSRPVKPRRRLESFAGEDTLIEDLLAGGGVGVAELAECGIDVGRIIGGLLDGDLPEWKRDGIEIPQGFLMMFADDGESDCSSVQEAQFDRAVTELLDCTGWGEIMSKDDESLETFVTQINEACDSFPPQLSPFNYDDDLFSPETYGAQQCLDFIFGDNPVGDLMRNIYRQPDKNCRCLSAFGDAVPPCLIHSVSDNVAVPGSLFRKAACLNEKAACGLLLDDMCRHESDALDRCLPRSDDRYSGRRITLPLCESVFEKCFEEGAVSVDLPATLTGGVLPDACANVSERDASSRSPPADGTVAKRFDQFYRACIQSDESKASDDNDGSVVIGAAPGARHEPTRDQDHAGGDHGNTTAVFLFAALFAATTAAFALAAHEKFRTRRQFTPIKDCCDIDVPGATE